MAAANTTFNIPHVEQLLKEKVVEVTGEHWRKAVRHVQTLQAEFQEVIFGSDYIEPIVTTTELLTTPLLLTTTSLVFRLLMSFEEDGNST